MPSNRSVRGFSPASAACLAAVIACCAAGRAEAKPLKQPPAVLQTLLPGQSYFPYPATVARAARVVKPSRRVYAPGGRGAKRPSGYPGQPAAGSSGATRQTQTRRTPASVSLASEVQALRTRHAAVASKLPAELRRLDGQALPTLEKLPHAAQFSYYTTVEDYSTLSTADQTRLRDVMQGIADLPEADRPRFVQTEAKTFASMDGEAQNVKQLRAKPHDLLFSIQTDLDHFKTPSVTPATPG